MFNPESVSAKQAASYYEKDDYYSREGLMPARWGGQLAPEFGLTGEFEQRKFIDMLHGKVGGKKWAKAPSLKRAALDCTISAPKSVSIQALVKCDHRILAAHDRAVEVAMLEVEKLARMRHTVKGKTTSTPAGKIAYASFQHHTSRDGDPNLHSHNVVFKCLVRPDGELLSLDNSEIMLWQKAMDAVYKQHLASELRGMGYTDLVMTKDGFELAGYEKEEIRHFSKRTVKIDKQLEERGMSRDSAGGAARNAAALATRDAKVTYDRGELIVKWQDELAQFPGHDLNSPFPTTKGQEKANTKTITAAAQHQTTEPPSPTPSTTTRKEQDRGNEHQPVYYAENFTDPLAAGEGRDLSNLSSLSLDAINARSDQLLLRDARNELSQQSARNEDSQMRRSEHGNAGANRIGTDASSSAGSNPAPGERGDAVGRDGSERLLTADEAVSQALAQLSQRQSVISHRSEIIREAIAAAEYRIDAQTIMRALNDKLARGEAMVGYNGKAIVTRESVNTERQLNENYDKGIDAHQAIATCEEAECGIAGMEKRIAERCIADDESAFQRKLTDEEKSAWHERAKLTRGQADMVRNVTMSRDGISVVEGDAGTGKSTGMEAVQIIATEKGYNVYGLAPSKQAVEALRGSGIETITSQAVTRHTKRAAAFWEKIDSKSVIVIDEAGLLDAKSMTYITTMARERGARVIAVGDRKQYSSPEAGSPLHQIADRAEKRGKLARLDEMRRWKNEVAKQLHYASRDNAPKVMDLLHDRGEIHIVRNREDRIEKMAKFYADLPKEERDNSYLLTGKNTDRIDMNNAVRKQLNLTGGVAVESFERKALTDIELRQLRSYEKGDVITFTGKTADFAQSASLKVIEKKSDRLIVENNGEQIDFRPNKQARNCLVGTVEKVDIAQGERIRFTGNDKDQQYSTGDKASVIRIDGEHIVAKLDKNGEEIRIPTSAGKPLDLRYGYASTGHSVQGGKTELEIKHMTADDPTITKASTYTDTTRHAGRMVVFTDAAGGKLLEKLRNSMNREAERDSALAALSGEKQKQSVKATYFAGRKGYEKLVVIDPTKREAVEAVFDEAAKLYGRDGNKLFVAGSDEFKKQIVEIAATKRTDVVFDDKDLEKARLARIQALEKRRNFSPSEVKAPKAPEIAPQAAFLVGRGQVKPAVPAAETAQVKTKVENRPAKKQPHQVQLVAVQFKVEQAKREAEVKAKAIAAVPTQVPPQSVQTTLADIQRATRIANITQPVLPPKQPNTIDKPRSR